LIHHRLAMRLPPDLHLHRRHARPPTRGHHWFPGQCTLPTGILK
jgi:hypothetical protein